MRKFIDNYETFVESLKQGKEYLKQGKLSQDILDSIVSIDNTKTKKYVGWLSKMYINEPFDIGSMKSYIEEYNVLVNRNLIEKDINKFKSISSFKSEVDKVNNTKSASNKELQNDYDVILDNETIYIVRPNTFEASRKLGLSTFAHRNNEGTGSKDSAWCTTYSNRDHWDDYYYKRNVTFYYCKIKDINLIEKLNSNYETNKKTTDLTLFAIATLNNKSNLSHLENHKLNDKTIVDIYDANDSQLKSPVELLHELNIEKYINNYGTSISRKKEKIKLFLNIFQNEVIEGDVIINNKLPNDIYCKTKIIKGDLIINNAHIPHFLENIEVYGNFICNNQKITSLKGSPYKVNGYVNISQNKITNFKYCPKYIGENLLADMCEINSLEYLPISIGKYISIISNNLTNIIGLDKCKIGTSIYLNNNKIENLKGIPQIIYGSLDISENYLNTLLYFPKEIHENIIYSDYKTISKEMWEIAFEKCIIKGRKIIS